MFSYKVTIRKSFGEIPENVRAIDGKVFVFMSSGYIVGGHADGEVRMVPVDKNYPTDAPKFLALGDLERIDDNV